MVLHISMVRHIVSHGCGFVCGCGSGCGCSWVVVSHIPMVSHTLGCALPILSPTVVDAVHIVGSDV